MSMNFFAPSTAVNLSWSGQYANLDSTILNNSADQNSIMALNATGNLIWVHFPIPSIDSDSQDQYAVVYNKATHSFILRDLRILYNPANDASLSAIYIFTADKLTFSGSNITSVKDVTNNANLSITSFTNSGSFNTVNNVLNIINQTGSPYTKMILPSTAYPTSLNNFGFSMALNYNLAAQNGVTPIIFSIDTTTRTDHIFNQIQGTSNFKFVLIARTENQTSSVLINNQGQPNDTYMLISFTLVNGVYTLYCNGKNMATFTSAINATINNFYIGGSSGGGGVAGGIYGAMITNNPTLSQIQKMEGYLKWNTYGTSSPFTLDSTHPYFTSAPTQ